MFKLLVLLFINFGWVYVVQLHYVKKLTLTVTFLMHHGRLFFRCIMADYFFDASWPTIFLMHHGRLFFWCIMADYFFGASWPTIFFDASWPTVFSRKMRNIWPCNLSRPWMHPFPQKLLTLKSKKNIQLTKS